MKRWLFICQVLEGAITWAEIKEQSIDEIDFLFEEADEINAKRNSSIRGMKTRGR